MEKTSNKGINEFRQQLKPPAFVEMPDRTIVRLKHPQFEIRMKDANYTQKELECALRSAYEWVKHGKRRAPESKELINHLRSEFMKKSIKDMSFQELANNNLGNCLSAKEMEDGSYVVVLPKGAKINLLDVDMTRVDLSMENSYLEADEQGNFVITFKDYNARIGNSLI